MANCLVVFIVVALLMRHFSFAAFKPNLMPSSDIGKSFKLLAECENSTDTLTAEITQCESKVVEVWRETRCRNLNVLIETAETRLNRLQSYLAISETESLREAVTDCSTNPVKHEEDLLEAELADLLEEVTNLNEALAILTGKEEELNDEIVALQNLTGNLSCEQALLKSEAKMLESQLKFQNWSAEALANIAAELHAVQNLTKEAHWDEHKAYEDCAIQLEELEQADRACIDRVLGIQNRLESINDAMQDAFQTTLADLEAQAVTCHRSSKDCRQVASTCLSDLGEAVRQQHRGELSLLRQRSDLEGCHRKTSASANRLNICREEVDGIESQTRLLVSETPGDPTEQQLACEEDVARCRRDVHICNEELQGLVKEESECWHQEGLCKGRWSECNRTLSGLIKSRQLPLMARLNELERDISKTMIAAQDCLRGKLPLEGDLSFIQEDLQRSQSQLVENNEAVRVCRRRGCHRSTPNPAPRHRLMPAPLPIGQKPVGRFRLITTKIKDDGSMPAWMRSLQG